MPETQPNQTLKILEIQLEAMYTNVRANGLTPSIKQQISHLKNQLCNAYKESAQETCDSIVLNINLENDPSKIFKSIERFQGNDKQKSKISKRRKPKLAKPKLPPHV